MSDLRHFRYGETDEEYTKLCRREKRFGDRRSKWVHDSEGKRHLLLFGVDKIDQHEQYWNGEAPQCKLKLPGCTGNATELDHIQGGDYGRCDCRHNMQPLCAECHRKKHNREIKSAKVSA